MDAWRAETSNDHAIIIGIDRYLRPEWELQSAVRDAEAFARWLLESGRVALADLTLLLSPRAGRTPGLAYREATQSAIRDAFLPYRYKRRGEGVARLWVFVAGHVVTAPNAGIGAALDLIPSDVDDLEVYLGDPHSSIGLYMSALRVLPPRDQVFFIDACRGVVEDNTGLSMHSESQFDDGRLDPATQSSQQAILLATTQGRAATVHGLSGLFSQALLEGLQGRGPVLAPKPGGASLTFSALYEYVRTRVAHLASFGEVPPHVSAPALLGTDGSLELVRFSGVPLVTLRVFVRPRGAREKGRASLLLWDEQKGIYEPADPRGPPIPEPVVWEVRANTYTVRVEAAGFVLAEQRIDISGPLDIQITLERSLGLESL